MSRKRTSESAVPSITKAKVTQAVNKILESRARLSLPEQRLWLAVIQRAVSEVCPGWRYSHYFKSEEFAMHCKWIGLEPDSVKRLLRGAESMLRRSSRGKFQVN